MCAAQTVNKDLKEEREKVTFEIEEFAKWYHGGVQQLNEKRFLGNGFRMNLILPVQNFLSILSLTENYFLSDPDLQSDVEPSFLSHKEKYEEAVRKLVVVLKRVEKLKSEGHKFDNIYK